MRMNIMHQLSILRLFELFGKSYLPKKFFTLFWKVKFAKQFLATNPGDRNKSLVLAIKIFAAGKAGAKV